MKTFYSKPIDISRFLGALLKNHFNHLSHINTSYHTSFKNKCITTDESRFISCETLSTIMNRMTPQSRKGSMRTPVKKLHFNCLMLFFNTKHRSKLTIIRGFVMRIHHCTQKMEHKLKTFCILLDIPNKKIRQEVFRDGLHFRNEIL